MQLDLRILWARRNHREPENTICFIVAKDIEDANNKSEFVNVVQFLVSKNYHVFMVVPDDTKIEEAASQASALWTWNSLLQAGEFPLEIESDDSDEEASDSEEEEESS